MKPDELLKIYSENSNVQLLAEGLRSRHSQRFQVKGLSGSLDAVVLASVIRSVHTSHFIICQDREEAAYLINDVQSLLGGHEVLLFPISYKKPYDLEAVENANVLMRAEVLDKLSTHPNSQIIVTSPEAYLKK